MSNLTYINTDQSKEAVFDIPTSTSGSTVTYNIYRTDGTIVSTGNATYIAGIQWKVTFTPNETGIWIVEVVYDPADLDVKHTQNFEAVSIGTQIPGPTPISSGVYALESDISGPGFDIPDGWSGAQVTELITDAQAWINELIRDDYSGLTELELLVDGTGSPTFYTRKYTKLCINSITSITWREGTKYSFTSANEWDETDYVYSKYYITTTNQGSRSIRTGGKEKFAQGIANYKIVGNFGHATLPRPLKDATVMLVREKLRPGFLKEQNATTVAWEDYRFVSPHTQTRLVQITGHPQVDIILDRYMNRATYMEMVS